MNRKLQKGGCTNLPASVEEFETLLKLMVAKRPYIPQPFARVMLARAATHRPLHEKIFQQILGSKPLEQTVEGLETPALITWGDQDGAVHAGGAEILHKVMPHSQVKVMPGIGHVPMMEDSEGTARDYLAFRTSLK